MIRAFLISFTTPVIRFYPIIMRYIFSTECIKQKEALDTWVIGSMAVAATFTLYLFWLVNKACLKEPVDLFLKGFIAFEICCILIDMQQTATRGFFSGTCTLATEMDPVAGSFNYHGVKLMNNEDSSNKFARPSS